MRIHFRILGPLEVVVDGEDVTPAAAKPRQVLALLLSRANRPVQAHELVDELWGETPPASATATLQTYVYKLRKVLPAGTLSRIGGGAGGRDAYQLNVPPNRMDHCRFDDLVEQGMAAWRVSDPERTADRLVEALRLWQGPALTGVSVGTLLTPFLTRLDERRLGAVESRINAELVLGRHQSVISDLKELTQTHPLHEGFVAELMVALFRSGRRSEALIEYHRLRELTSGELGVEPSERLRQLHHALLANDRDTIGGHGPGRRRVLGPAQLPPDTDDFTGQQEAFDRARRWLTDPNRRGAPAAVLITGMPGVGKTALAVRIARGLRSEAPDGQFFADLAGLGSTPVDPAQVLGGFLRAAGLNAGEIPDDLDGRAKLFRGLTADRAAVVVLDNVVSTEQVLPLLPGGARCAVILTSDLRLSGPPGTLLVDLPPLSMDDAFCLLSKLIGAERVASQRRDAQALLDQCGGLPMAIRWAAAKLAEAPGWPVATLLDQLAGPATPPPDWGVGGPDILTRLQSGLGRLDDQARDGFARLAALPAEGFDADQAAAELGVSAAEAVLDRLVEHNLLVAVGPTRFAFHRLVLRYARKLLVSTDAGTTRPPGESTPP
ncbi:AfsR/SARP family transcriptional regulator [Kutzneria chonburiensis]|uniref:BTAD domain-containing putative transcriptional regulator n=1 Tax=Kutzneria chonburiensis TaxID=1483604 RepID=A0ABV6MS44_9PSEU|nr:BTAD domain-containing putative transcriptional regulator [Kutzneria chonburiensis]